MKTTEKKNKALLVGNGFTSQLIPGLKNESLMKKTKELIPNEIESLELFFDPFRALRGFDEYQFIEAYEDDSYFDSEDTEMVSTVSFSIREELPRNAFEKYNDIIKSTYPNLCHDAKKVFTKFFVNAGLIGEVGNDAIEGIESPIKIAKLAVRAGYWRKDQELKVRNTIKNVFYNQGKFHFSDCKFSSSATINDAGNTLFSAFPSREKLSDFLAQYSCIFTTNYDLVLDDIVFSKVRHLHGGFGFRSPYVRLKQGEPTDASNYDIITAADGEDKEKAINKHIKTEYAKYMELLETGDFSEIFILGYSGENDAHINNRIRNNPNIKRIFCYVSPKYFKPDAVQKLKQLQRHLNNTFCGDCEPPENGEKKVCLIPWDEFWDSIKEPLHDEEKGGNHVS